MTLQATTETTAEKPTDEAPAKVEPKTAGTTDKASETPADKAPADETDKATIKTTDGTTVLDDAGDGDKADPVKADADKAKAFWPDDWRQKLAGGDDKLLKRLERFSSPDNVLKSWLSAEQKIKSGELKKALADDASEEEIAEWRKDNGIPATASAYEAPKLDAYEWTKADKPMLDSFFERAHQANASQKTVDEMLGWYADTVQAQQEGVVSIDREDKIKVEEGLRADLGAEYRPSMTLFARLLKDETVFPEGLGLRFVEARLADGHRLINDARIARFFIDLAREKYGDGGMITGDGAARLADRKAAIQKIMRSNIAQYRADGLDKEYAEILERESRQRR